MREERLAVERAPGELGPRLEEGEEARLVRVDLEAHRVGDLREAPLAPLLTVTAEDEARLVGGPPLEDLEYVPDVRLLVLQELVRGEEQVADDLVLRGDDAALVGGRVAEHHRVLAAYELDTRLPAGVDHDQLVSLMGRDKKAIGGLTFVLDGPAGVEVVPGVAEPDARAALEEIT